MAIAERELTAGPAPAEIDDTPAPRAGKKKPSPAAGEGLKILCDRKALAEALGVACRAVASRTSLPILKAVRLQAGDDGLSLLATDLEVWIEVRLPPGGPLEVLSPGSLALPGKLLESMLARLPDGIVGVRGEGDGNTARIKCGRSEYKALGWDPEEFPVLQQSETTARFALDRDGLALGLRRTLFATSDDQTRPMLTGVLFRFADDALTMAATDTHRLCVTPCPAGPTDVPETFVGQDCITPERSLAHLKAMLEKADGPVEATVSPRDVRFSLTRKDGVTTLLQARLIDGRFPSYERVIPAGREQWIRADRQALLGAARRAQIVALDSSNRLSLRPLCEGAGIVVSGQSGSAGDCTDEVEAAVSAGVEPFAVNCAYFIQALEAIESEGVIIWFSSPLHALVLHGTDEPDYDCVCMPMQVVN